MAHQPTITIVGAGISGLTLGRALRSRSFPAVLYERDDGPRHSYSIKLHSSTFEPLLTLLDIDLSTFRRKCGLNGPFGDASSKNEISSRPPSSLRVHRSRFESLLRESLTVHNVKRLAHAGSNIPDKGATLTFEDGEQIRASHLVAADGSLSAVRQCLLPLVSPQVLPYVVFNGKRSFGGQAFKNLLQHFNHACPEIELCCNGVLFQAYINDFEQDQLNVSFTYSRQADPNGDSLYRPNRSNSEATQVPKEFFEELEQYQGSLQEPFKTIFDVNAVRNSRVLHWLMRSTMVSDLHVLRLASARIMLLGDALHCMPILGSAGANLAIKDALQLSDCIAKGTSLIQFYQSRFAEWNSEVNASQTRLAEMHTDDGRASL